VATVVAETRTLSKLIFGSPDEDSESESDSEQECKWEPAVLEVGRREGGFSNNNLGVGGAILIAGVHFVTLMASATNLAPLDPR
jgi:hypothetical protein